jgi:hypothetical protein
MSHHSDIEKGSGLLGSPIKRPSTIANPGALGLFSFASTTFILSLINVQARGVAVPNVVVGMAIFTGGLVQLLAGMWEFPRGNVFGGTAFSSYGAFWMSYATILLPSTGVIDAYAKSPPDEFTNAIGIYLIAWFMFTFFMLIGALRKNIAFIALFACLAATFAALAAGAFMPQHPNVTKAGGALGIVTAFIAYYCAVSELLVKEDSYFSLPLGHIPKRSL